MNRIILEKYLRIGDRIVMQMGPEARGYGRKGPPDGTQGTVHGFHRYTKTTGRGIPYQRPGIYQGNGAVIVQWDMGEVYNPSAHDICFLDQSLNKVRAEDKAWNEAFTKEIKIGELPELPLYELDTVHINKDIFGKEHLLAVVKSIDYDDLGKKRDNGSNYPIYNISPVGYPGTSRCVCLEDIIGVESRGNHWAWENDKSKLKFENLREKAAFYTSLGFSTEIRNPKNGLYAWAIEEAVEAVRNGIGDGIHVSNGFFGALPSIRVVKFEGVPELAQEVREETLKGFAEV